jgi:transposase
MANAMLDARHDGDSYRRIEVITGKRRRRHWTAEEKARIVAESFEAGANISEVARRHGVVRGLLTVWRHKFAAAAAAKVASFVPVRIDAGGDLGTGGERDGLPAPPTQLSAKAPQLAKLGGAVEIELSGARVRVEPGADPTTLCTVLSALRGGR